MIYNYNNNNNYYNDDLDVQTINARSTSVMQPTNISNVWAALSLV